MNLSDALTNTSRTVVPSVWLRMRRMPGPKGKMADMAIEVLAQAQWKDGVRVFGKYAVGLSRGDSLTSLAHLADVIGAAKRSTAKRMLKQICKEMDWTMEPVTSKSDRVTKGTPPWDPLSGVGGSPVGVVITISNYDRMSRFGYVTPPPRGDRTMGPPDGPPPILDPPIPDPPIPEELSLIHI
jgi:hypothetical protein